MFGSETLDAAIGLIFLFLLLSLVSSSIREAFETVLHDRARDLEKGIREILQDPEGGAIVKEFYDHPLVSALFQGKYSPGGKNLPSYIPSRTFALAVMDLMQPATAARPTALAQLRDAVSLAQNPAMQRALLPLIDAAGNDLGRARQNIEDWYNAAMDRVSGWYKRRTQIIIAAIGITMAILMNIDALAIGRYLETNQTARAALISRLSASSQISGPPTPELIDPLGWLERQGGIPLGWRFHREGDESQEDFNRDWRKSPATVGGWILKCAGILFTAFAVTLGAPFWFDVLNKFMVVRSTVKPQEKSPPETSKD